MGATLLEGRYFEGRDGTATPPVVVVDQGFARRFFPGESAVGKRIKGNDRRGRDDEWLTIVGVVADMRREGLERRTSAHVFQWARQSGEATRDLLIRTRSDPLAMAATIRAVVRDADPTAVVTSVTTLEAELDRQLESRRFHGALISTFALLALGLAGLGMFGTVHYAVSRRTREVGVRLALGATAVDVVSLFLRQVSGPVLTGAMAGSLVALGVARGLASLLFGVSPLDPLTHSMALVTLSLVVLLASLIPALRATRLDPLLALRQD
jgi:putative ABC transport system permease protein